MKNSAYLDLNWLDLGKLFLVALLGFILDYLQVNFIPSLPISEETRTLISFGVAYLIKNFFQGKPENLD